MPLFEYVLLALIGSSGAAGGTPTTFGPDAIVQPNGGASIAAQDNPPKKEDIRRSRYRRIHKHRRHGGGKRKIEAGKDKKGKGKSTTK